MTTNPANRELLEKGPVLISREVFDFLMGVGELEGASFGDLNSGRLGRFWWRSLLRASELLTPKALADLTASLKDTPNDG